MYINFPYSIILSSPVIIQYFWHKTDSLFCVGSHGSVDLSTDEKAQVLELLPKGTSNEETDNVLTILSQIHAGITSEEDISDQDQVSRLSFSWFLYVMFIN